MKKFDDTYWHIQEENMRPHQAGAHIAFYFCWLLTRQLLDKEILQNIEQKWGEDKQVHSPFEYLEYFADGKLLSTSIDTKATAFTEHYYESDYLNLIDDMEHDLERDPASKSTTYNLANSWKNASLIATRLDKAFKDWLKNNDNS